MIAEYTDDELGNFAWRLAQYCPILNITSLRRVYFGKLNSRDELIRLYELGWGWCVNWELIASGRNSLN